jgi:hypothetical protein
MKIPDWKKSYQDVLFERDQSRVATTIVSAQLVMRGRLRELHRDGHDIEERKAVDAALCQHRGVASLPQCHGEANWHCCMKGGHWTRHDCS